ncbi:hypothetical protein O9K51_00794 [Purpureocillium lavendulum]|uniref:Uncharacterized protein n=1 Tax=Purpureocillium lavendulum TaxID=1247861 RepID=A0AB34G5K2_9HYPO|nr:hypothetical protein O9K51_00794 [Purpureocillium lavendulum]
MAISCLFKTITSSNPRLGGGLKIQAQRTRRTASTVYRGSRTAAALAHGFVFLKLHRPLVRAR